MSVTILWLGQTGINKLKPRRMIKYIKVLHNSTLIKIDTDTLKASIDNNDKVCFHYYCGDPFDDIYYFKQDAIFCLGDKECSVKAGDTVFVMYSKLNDRTIDDYDFIVISNEQMSTILDSYNNSITKKDTDSSNTPCVGECNSPFCN